MIVIENIYLIIISKYLLFAVNNYLIPINKSSIFIINNRLISISEFSIFIINYYLIKPILIILILNFFYRVVRTGGLYSKKLNN